MNLPTRGIPSLLAGALWPVRLGDFHGPLDLLVHLVRTEALPLSGLPLLEVARQYERYLDLMRDLDLEAAGESLVLVAALIHLKSRQLLPPDPAAIAPEAEDDGAVPTPPRPPEIRRAAEVLQEREAVMELVYARPAAKVAEFSGEQGIDADLFALLKAFQEILGRVGSDEPSRITRERFTLVERMTWLLETLQRERRVGFQALFGGIADRLSAILTFLALLEVMRLRLVRAHQSHHQADIMIVLQEEEPPPAAPEPEEPVHA